MRDIAANQSSLESTFEDISMQQSGYNTRSSKKKLVQANCSVSPDHRADGEHGASTAAMTTRSRANAQSDSRASRTADPCHSDAQEGARTSARSSGHMSSDRMEAGSAAGVASGDGGGQQAVRSVRSRADNPVKKLTVRLLDTYQGINEKYYARHKKVFNDGYDDENGDYIVRVGDTINDRYEILQRPGGKPPFLGKGSFGQVVYAMDRGVTPPQAVAIKIIKNHKHWHEQAKSEIELLRRLRQMPCPEPGVKWVEYANVVRLQDDFVFRNHCCLVFELLPFTLYDLLKFSEFKGVSLSLVRKFARNLIRTLDCLRQPEVDVIHCDLKPENVMLVKHNEYRLKVIDFGSSCSSRRQPFTYIQSRFYRSPEVLLCRPYSHSIDVWSLGCILVEMHTGKPLFNGENEVKQMCKICDVLGLPPKKMVLEAGPKSKVKSIFRIGPGSEYSIYVDEKHVPVGSRKFRDIVRKPPVSTTKEDEDAYMQFEDLVLRMLALDPDLRITPAEALQHPFIARGGGGHASAGGVSGASGQVEAMQISPRPEPAKVDQEVQTERARPT